MSQDYHMLTVRVKEEPIWDDPVGASEAARAELYADHVVKDEMVFGPVVLQPVDAVFIPDVKSNPCTENDLTPSYRSPESISNEQDHLKKKFKQETCFNRNVKEQFELKSCSVGLERISQHDITIRKQLINTDVKLYSYDDDENESRVTYKKAAPSQTGDRKYACDICGRKFTAKSSLPLHLRIHSGEKPFACDFCGRQFRQSGDLVHHTRTHTGEKPHLCNTCGRRFNQKSDLIIHTRIHTGDKPYTCMICETRFRHQSTLKSHMQSHDNVKPYGCDTCGKRYARRRSMMLHARLHMDEKKYSCNECGSIFLHKSYLNSHMKTHNGMKYLCGDCGKRFRHKPSLRRHAQIHKEDANVAPVTSRTYRKNVSK